MNESYIEMLVKKKPSILPKLMKGLCGTLTVLSVLAGLLIYPVFLIFAVVFGAVTYFAHMNTDLEYEYLFVDKELSIDVIRAKSSRKKIADYEVNRMEIFAPAASHRLDEYNNRSMTVKDYSSHLEDSTPYVMIYNGDNGLQKIILEGNDELRKCFYNVSPRKVFSD